jgi:hypothetical protein
MYLQNKYTRIYFLIIERAKSRTLSPEVYVERHHIIPKSLGGDNTKFNLVSLTAREHFICHLLLPRMTIGVHKQKMTFAAWALTMKKDITDRKISNRTYQKLKEERAKLLRGKPMSEKQRLNLIKVNTGKSCSEEKKAKIREARKLQITTEETKIKMSKARIGKKHSPKTIEKMQQSAKLKLPMSEETKTKIKEARAKQIIHTIQVTCPHCGKIGGNRIMPRYHFDNCRLK